MFDLIDESGSDLSRYGYKVKTVDKFGTSVAKLYVDSEEKSKDLGLDAGEYFIVSCPKIYENEAVSELVTAHLFEIFDKLFKSLHGKRTLVVGLGNPEIWADCLGKCVVDNVEIEALKENNHIFKFCPNIFFSTGINTFDMVSILAKGLDIECIIVVDSLATNSLERLGKSIQISSAGMTPGSAVNALGKKINFESTGCKCFSIGVPFMLFAKEGESDEVLLAPKDIHENVHEMGRVIGDALNLLLCH